MSVIFQEEQRFSKWIIYGTAVIMLITTFSIWFAEGDSEDLNLATKLLLSLLPIGITLLMFVLKLQTVITTDFIIIRYIPFVSKKWYWKDIMNPEVIDYGFVGGWGIRIWTGYGTVYNTRGSKGLHFKVQSGSKTKEYVVGSQKPKELEKVLQQISI